MGVIKQLAPEVVNKIAAGEIIVAPANALKELLENAIDAGSTNVQIVVKNGGLKLLKVTDNGHGIHKEDLSVLCDRFTTSKLSSFDDLKHIATYGFRGEALASISHVAQLTVVTRRSDCPHAWQARYLDGKLMGEPVAVAGAVGTQISVENLFYNFKARLASLRQPHEEFQKIVDVVSKYAVRTRGVGFSVKKIGDSQHSLIIRDVADYKDRIRTVFGTQVARNLVDVTHSDAKACDGLQSFSVWFTDSNYTTGSRKSSQMVFFVNGRLVECNPLRRALNNAFSPFLPRGCKPFVFADLQITPEQLDVNMHPTKKEVRFLHEDEVVARICSTIVAKLDTLDGSRVFKAQMVRPQMHTVDIEDKTENVDVPVAKRPRLELSQLQRYAMGEKRDEKRLLRVDLDQRKITSFLSVGTAENATSQDSGSEPKNAASAAQFSQVHHQWREVTLKSIEELRNDVHRAASVELSEVFTKFAFVGVVQFSTRMLVIQHNISLFLVDYGKLFYELFYQMCMADFSNFGTVRLSEPVDVQHCVKLVLADKMAPEQAAEQAKVAANTLAEVSDMLQDYFSIKVENGQLHTVPLLLNNYVPPLSKISLFVYRLAFQVDFSNEKTCFHDLSRQIALFYTPETGNDADENSELVKKIEFLLDVVKRRFVATRAMRDSVIEVANLPSLYKRFERC